MFGKFNHVFLCPEIASLSEEYDQCKKLLETSDEAKYTNEEGSSVLCFKGENADDITIIISHP